jgi:ATP-dependent Clp protease ATP-binding subunit ClpA
MDMDPSQFITNQSIQAGTGNITPAELLLSEDSQLVIDLKRNPNRILFFDEIDKYKDKDPNNTILETFGRGKDSGTLPVRKKDGTVEYLDISGTICFFTTNQLMSCWGGYDNEESLKDPTRTKWSIDTSLTRRFYPIEFKKFNEESYEKLLCPLIDLFVKECNKNYKINCILDKNFIPKLAKECVLTDRGARGCNDLIVEICGSLVEYKMQTELKDKKINSLNVDFDTVKRFIFEKINF